MRILIVEDDIVIRALLKVRINKQFVHTFDFDVQSVAKLSEAMVMKETFNPDVVILDLGLEDSSTEETIKAIPVLSYSAAVIVVSNGLTKEIVADCYEAGATDVVDKFKLSIESLKDRIAAAHYKSVFKAKS